MNSKNEVDELQPSTGSPPEEAQEQGNKEDQEWFNEKTHQFLQSLLLKDSHKTAKALQTKSHSLKEYTDQTIASITQIPLSPDAPFTKDNIDSMASDIIAKLDMFKRSLQNYNVFTASMKKKFLNSALSIKCQLIAMVSKPKEKQACEGPSKTQALKVNKQKATVFSRTIVQNSVNKQKSNNLQLLSLNECRYFPIQEIQYIAFPTVAQSNFLYEEVAKETKGKGKASPLPLSNSKPSSIAIFGTTQNLFFALGFEDLVIISDSSMTIADKLVLEKLHSTVKVLFVSAYLLFFSHSHFLHIFNYETKQTSSLSFDHQIIAVCPVLYYFNCLCALDSFENINLIDYAQPKKLGSFQTKFIKAKTAPIACVISLNNHLILGGSTLKIFDVKTKKVVPVSPSPKGANLLPMSDNPIMKMAPIVLNGRKHIDSFILLMKSGSLELFSLDKSSQLHKVGYYAFEGTEPTGHYCLVVTRSNLVISSVGFDIKVLNLAIKEEAQLGYMPFISELATIRVNNAVTTVFEIKHSLILHGEDVIERFMFLDLDEVFMRNKEFDYDRNGDSQNWNEKDSPKQFQRDDLKP